MESRGTTSHTLWPRGIHIDWLIMYRSANPQISFHSSYHHFFLLFFNSPTFFAALIHTYSTVWLKQIWLRCFPQSALCCATHRQSRKKYLWRRRCRDWGCCCQLWGDSCLDEPISILWRWLHLPEPNGPVFLDELFYSGSTASRGVDVRSELLFDLSPALHL